MNTSEYAGGGASSENSTVKVSVTFLVSCAELFLMFLWYGPASNAIPLYLIVIHSPVKQLLTALSGEGGALH